MFNGGLLGTMEILHTSERHYLCWVNSQKEVQSLLFFHFDFQARPRCVWVVTWFCIEHFLFLTNFPLFSIKCSVFFYIYSNIPVTFGSSCLCFVFCHHFCAFCPCPGLANWDPRVRAAGRGRHAAGEQGEDPSANVGRCMVRWTQREGRREPLWFLYKANIYLALCRLICYSTIHMMLQLAVVAIYNKNLFKDWLSKALLRMSLDMNKKWSLCQQSQKHILKELFLQASTQIF